MDENHQGGEPIEEVQTHPPKGTLIRKYCSLGAQMYYQYADGLGGKTDVYQGLSTNCANSIMRDHLAGHLAWYANLCSNTNMLKKVEAAEIAKQLGAMADLVRAATYVMETSEGNFAVMRQNVRPLTFLENVLWKLFGAVPYAKSQNDLIAAAYEKAGVVIIQEAAETD